MLKSLIRKGLFWYGQGLKDFEIRVYLYVIIKGITDAICVIKMICDHLHLSVCQVQSLVIKG